MENVYNHKGIVLAVVNPDQMDCHSNFHDDLEQEIVTPYILVSLKVNEAVRGSTKGVCGRYSKPSCCVLSLDLMLYLN